MSTFTKYLLFQIPGWILAAVVLTLLRYNIDLPGWILIGLFGGWVIKDLALYPLLRTAYESNAKSGVEQLIGERGVAQQELSPSGYVRVRGELWLAEVKRSDRPISPGSPIRVLSARGMTLIVDREEA